MGFLSHLFYPWGFLLQIVALVHFFWRRRANFIWVWIIFIGGFVGAAAYLIVEVLSEADLLRTALHRRARKARISAVEAQILDNPSVANLEELGELYWDEKDYAKARDAFDRAIQTRSDSSRTFYRRGLCALELGDAAAAVSDLELAFRTEPKLDSYRGGMFLARAYVATGRDAEAAKAFSEAMQHTSTPEMLFSYAAFLKSQNQKEEAREWLDRLEEKRRTAPRFVQRTERPWFNKGKALLKELSALMIVLAAGVAGAHSVAQAQGAPPVVIETVTIGNPGNAEDTQMQGIFGAVGYVYAIGKYEVTAGQYAAFLNAVAATDTYALYNVNMWTHAQGCKIERAGSPGSYAYGVAPDWANRPVNFVSWGDAARFANWLHNGQPTGAQDLTTTEDGTYFLNGMASDKELEDVVREPDATWVIPTENEWYKAAYHRNEGVTGNYFLSPTGPNPNVSNDLIDPDPGNNATFSGGTVGDWTIGAPYYRTEVGAHENSGSPYGTFDQGGNVQEFNETVPEPDIRGIRGGSWFWGLGSLLADSRPIDMHSSDQYSDLGFRVVTLACTDVTNLRGFDPVATYFQWDPMPGGSDTVYDVARGNLANVSGNASAVDLGPLTCIEDDSHDESSHSHPDTEVPAPNTAFFYVVRFQEGPVLGPWGFGSEGQERTGTGGCPPL